MPGKPSIFSCSTINMELFTIHCQQLPKFCPFVSALKDTLFRSRERKFQGTKVPGSESSTLWNFRSWEQKFLGAKVPASFKCAQRSPVTNWRCSLTVALRLTMPVTPGSNPSLYHIFLFIFHSVYPIRDTVMVRVRVSIFGVRDSISILSLRCYSTAGTRYLVARVPVKPVTGTV